MEKSIIKYSGRHGDVGFFCRNNSQTFCEANCRGRFEKKSYSPGQDPRLILPFLLLQNWITEILSLTADSKKIDFAVGGQAVIEGVMMRSPNSITIAVRKQDGKIKVKADPYKTLTQRYKWLNFPIARGVINLFEMMVIGTKAINFSANESLEETRSEPEGRTECPSKSKKGTTSRFFSIFFEYFMLIMSVVIALALSIALFKFIPLWITTFFESKSTYIKENYIVFNLIDGFLKTFIFLSYIFILTLIPNFRRVFEYHGAEHKSIFTYENHLSLDVKNAKSQTRFHPRCGTSFILIVFVISIIVYTFVPKQEDFLINFGTRLFFLPLIAGISYEYLKLSAKYSKNSFVKALIAPGLWFQKLTTKEPDNSQLEVGLKSLSAALEMEK